MNIVTKNEMVRNLFNDFAYEDNPLIFSKVIFLGIFNNMTFKDNKKMISGYFEAPIGS